MGQGLAEGDALAGVQDEHLLQEVLELSDLAVLVVRQPLVANQLSQEVFAGANGGHHSHLLLQRQQAPQGCPISPQSTHKLVKDSY